MKIKSLHLNELIWLLQYGEQTSEIYKSGLGCSLCSRAVDAYGETQTWAIGEIGETQSGVIDVVSGPSITSKSEV